MHCMHSLRGIGIGVRCTPVTWRCAAYGLGVRFA